MLGATGAKAVRMKSETAELERVNGILKIKQAGI
jgi:hypothetical protein